MLDLLQLGVEVRYYYPELDPDEESLRAYDRLQLLYGERGGHDPPLPVRGFQVHRSGRHLFGWRSRFVVISRVVGEGAAQVVEHVFEYLRAGLADFPGNANSESEEVWIRLENDTASDYVRALADYSEPVDAIGIYENRLESPIQDSYRQQFVNPQQVARYARLRDSINTTQTVSGILEEFLDKWWAGLSRADERPRLVRLLDIGTGDGHVLAHVRDFLSKRLRVKSTRTRRRHAALGALRITAVEPARVPPNMWSAVLDESATLRVNEAFEDFDLGDEEYDLVLAVHSWYLIDPSYLKKVYDGLGANGMALIVLAPFRDNVLNAVCSAVDELIGTENVDVAAVRPFGGKVVGDDPIRVYAEDLVAKAREAFSSGAVHVRKYEKKLDLRQFIASDNSLASLTWDAIEYGCGSADATAGHAALLRSGSSLAA